MAINKLCVQLKKVKSNTPRGYRWVQNRYYNFKKATPSFRFKLKSKKLIARNPKALLERA